LLLEGADTIFGYPGGAILHVYDELAKMKGRIRHVLVRHEQGAVHAAEGFARSTGKVGVAMVTSGPGATNTVTGLANAYMDSTPIVVITGQVPTHLIGNDAFQECDTVGITRPCTKHNYLVKSVAELPRVLHEAFHIAKSGRPGPVVVDIPKDIQFAKGTYSRPKDFQHKGYHPKVKGDLDRIKAAIELMRHAKRPLFYTGGGVVNSGPEASHLLRELVKLTGFPITSTLMGLGAYVQLGEGRLLLGCTPERYEVIQNGGTVFACFEMFFHPLTQHRIYRSVDVIRHFLPNLDATDFYDSHVTTASLSSNPHPRYAMLRRFRAPAHRAFSTLL